MDEYIVVYIILSVIIVTVVILCITWSLTVQTIPTYTAAPQYTLASYGGRCTTETLVNGQNRPDQYPTQKCSAGLSCINGYCFKDFGTKCNNLYECIPGTLICNGHCSNTGKGGLDDVCTIDADCDTNLSCDNNLCKKNINTFCSITDDCVSTGYCNNSVCTLFSNPGNICNSDSCTNGFTCSTSAPNNPTGTYPSFCQPSNTSNGLQGAYCSLWNDPNGQIVTDGGSYQYVDGLIVPSCSNGYTCNIVRDNNGLTTSSNGFCSLTGDWDGTCDSTIGCQNPQVCVQGRCILPITTDGISCDRLNSSGICLDDYKCNTSNKCVGVNGNIPAVASTNCYANLSAAKNIVWKYFDSSSWTNSQINIPALFDTLDSYNIFFTSTEQSDNSLSALFHQFSTNNYYICNNIGYTEYKLSSNIVGNFTTNINYVGTDTDNNPDFNASVEVKYSGVADYVGYTTRGNYFTVVRYTVVSSVYSSPPFGGIYGIPNIQNFSRIYYDTVQDFSNNVLAINGYPEYSYYNNDIEGKIITYIYSISVDDRIIDPNFPNSARIFLVVGDTDAPVNSVNEGSSQRNGVIVSVQIDTSNLQDYTLTYYVVSRSNVIVDNGAADYSMTWCSAYIYRTINTNGALKECYGKSNDTTRGSIRKYISTFPGFYFREDFPYETREGESKYLSSIGIFSSKVLDSVKSSIAYIFKDNSDYYLGSSKYGLDYKLPGSVDNKTLLSVPSVSSNLDTINYKPKILLYSKTCL